MEAFASKPASQHLETTKKTTDTTSEMIHQQRTTCHMIIFAFWIGFFGWLANFDAAFGGIVLLMEPYKKSFGSCTATTGASGETIHICSLTALQQSLVQLTLLFMAVGGFTSGLVGDYIGRRGSVQIGCVLIAAGAAGMTGSVGNFLAYMVCKCIGGIGIGMLYTAAPIWGSESIAPQKRGLLMSLYNVGLASGNVVAAAVCVGSSKLSTNWAWQTPIICQVPVATILTAGSFLFHESPRWLLRKGRTDEARLSFAKFYQLDPQSPEISWQINDVVRHIETERMMRSEVSFKEIFRAVDFRRTHIAVVALLGNALTGIQFVIPYTALFLSQIGITNPYALNVAISSCVLVGTLPGPFLCEYVGRRLSLLGGYAVMGTSMLILAVVASILGQSHSETKNVLVAFLCIWAFTFGATCGPISFVSSAEMHSLRLRTIGQGYAIAIYEIFSFGAAFWTPYMINEEYGNMGTNVGYFYFGITTAIFALTLLYIPETGRLSLEQIDEYFFNGGKAWGTNLRKNKKIAAGM